MKEENAAPANFNARMAGEMTKGIPLKKALDEIYRACQIGDANSVAFPPFVYFPPETISGLMDRGFKVSRGTEWTGLKNTIVEWEPI